MHVVVVFMFRMNKLPSGNGNRRLKEQKQQVWKRCRPQNMRRDTIADRLQCILRRHPNYELVLHYITEGKNSIFLILLMASSTGGEKNSEAIHNWIFLRVFLWCVGTGTYYLRVRLGCLSSNMSFVFFLLLHMCRK